MSCYCDYDSPEFISTDTRTARKQHKCCECGHVIGPGEKYEHVGGKWDGRFDTFDTCEMCVDLRDSLAAQNGGCFQYRGLNEYYLGYLQMLLPRGADALHAGVFAKHQMGHNDQAKGRAESASSD